MNEASTDRADHQDVRDTTPTSTSSRRQSHHDGLSDTSDIDVDGEHSKETGNRNSVALDDQTSEPNALRTQREKVDINDSPIDDFDLVENLETQSKKLDSEARNDILRSSTI